MELKHRSEFPENELWDLSALYQDREDFLRHIEKTLEDINLFTKNYQDKLSTVDDFTRALYEIEQIYIEMSHIDNYAFMPQTTDFSNEEFAQIAKAGADFFTKANVELSFFDTALATADSDILDALEANPHFSTAIRQAKIKKSHFISPEVEKTLTNLGEVFSAPQDIYTKMRAGAYDLVMKSVAPLGQEYANEVSRFRKERWVDFAANANKDSGGYAADPYKVHPYILMSWTGRMSDVYTLIHEIGHSGQFIFSDNNQSYFNTHMSTYYVEAPSTFNELLLSDYLEKQFDNPRQKRFALAHRLTDTYFHNFITHLLEAAFQRRVYNLIEEGKTFGAEQLNNIMKDVLSQFWGDAVEIDDDAALTWMRQSHYYMGLYSYTYSAGMVISTTGYLNLKNNPNGDKDWLNFLKSGGSRTPLDTAKLIGADISTAQPLRDTIQFLSDTVDQIITYTEELNHD